MVPLPRNMCDEAAGSTSQSRGALIVLEGCDRSGKTTQSKLLVDNLRKAGHRVEFMRFPNRDTPIGREIDEYMKGDNRLDNQQIHLLFSRNRWEQDQYMRDQLAQGVTLVVDRYAHSGVVYSVAKGLSLAWCKQPDIGLPRPDALLFLDLPPAKAATRGGYGEEIYERHEFQQKVYDVYQRLIKDEADTLRWKVLDADRPVDELSADLLQLCDDEIRRAPRSPSVLPLWIADRKGTDNGKPPSAVVADEAAAVASTAA